MPTEDIPENTAEVLSPEKEKNHEPPGTPVAATGFDSDAEIRPALPAHSVRLEVYEGPLDLLLDLIRKQQINIYDIPIAKITDQYLGYLQEMERMDLDVEGEFLFMAATLIHIKSRLLLPTPPPSSAGEPEDPRTELVHRLLEHEKFKNAAQVLQSKRAIEEATWSSPGVEELEDAEGPGLAVNLYDLIRAFHGALERARYRQPLQISTEPVSVTDMMERIQQVLSLRSHPVPLEEFFVGPANRRALIALFLALLEMVRSQAIGLYQKEPLSPITVHKSRKFAEILAETPTDWLEQGWQETFK